MSDPLPTSWGVPQEKWDEKRRRAFSPSETTAWLDAILQDLHDSAIPFDRACTRLKEYRDSLQPTGKEGDALRTGRDHFHPSEGAASKFDPAGTAPWCPMLRTGDLQISLYTDETLEIRDGQAIYAHLTQSETADFLHWIDSRDKSASVQPAGTAPSPHDWPEDAAHENGSYQNKCTTCGMLFVGHKRRVTCKVCAGTAPDIEAIALDVAESLCHEALIYNIDTYKRWGNAILRVPSRLREADRKEIERLKAGFFNLRDRHTELQSQLTAMTKERDEAQKALALIGEKAVDDWDYETVGKVDAVVPANKYSDWLRLIMKEAVDASTLRARVAELESENTRLRDYDASVEDWMARCQRVEKERDTAVRQWTEDFEVRTHLLSERDSLAALVKAIRDRLLIADVGSCTCQTKSPEVRWHTIQCPHRVFGELLALTPESVSRKAECDDLAALVKSKDEALRLMRHLHGCPLNIAIDAALALTPDTVSRQFVRREVPERLVSACEEYIAERLMEADLIAATKAARAELGGTK